jgi:hypothetical protein
MLNLEYPAILDLFRQHLDPKRRSESASFLIWFLENYYRLDPLEAMDAVCDQRGDKGVDGIYLNDADNTIDVLQSRISQRKTATVGDTALKEFYGTLSQFRTKKALKNLCDTSGETQVASLVKRLDLLAKVEAYDIRGVYVTNIELDGNGSAFLASAPDIVFYGRNRLAATYVSDKKASPIARPVTFDVAGLSVAEYIVDVNTKSVIAPLKATELTNLHGIADQSLFDLNVRGALGSTKVNRDIVNSIHDAALHKQFPLFHNGITIICQNMRHGSEKITINKYFVVNGCQSLNALYNNKRHLTDDLRILTKIIRMDVKSNLAQLVTRYSNNQNGVKARDFKSNNQIQIRLQNEFNTLYGGRFSFEIKRGEILSGTVVSNEEAGLLLLAFDLKEPWATHRKYQVFEDKYADIFGRPVVNADRIVLCYTLMQLILKATDMITNKLFGKYVLTKRSDVNILMLESSSCR